MPVPTIQQKQAAAVLSNISDGLEEIAFTETGESDAHEVLDICAAMLTLATRAQRLSLYMRHGYTPTKSDSSSDTPF